MKNIKWLGIVKSPSEFPKGELPKTANELEEPDTMDKMMLVALPFVIPSIMLLFFSMFIKAYLNKANVIKPLFIFVGIVIGLLLLVVHELLHAVLYPKKANVGIGIMPKQLAAVVLVSYPLSRKRFIAMSLFPIILGIIPLVCFWFSPASKHALNGILFGLAAIGMTSPYPDFFNVYNVVKQTPPNAKIQVSGSKTYWFLDNDSVSR